MIQLEFCKLVIIAFVVEKHWMEKEFIHRSECTCMFVNVCVYCVILQEIKKTIAYLTSQYG